MGERPVEMQEIQDNMFLPLIAPPFIITEEQIDECIRVLRETIEESQELPRTG